MSVSKVPSQEWFLILMHELLHASDADLLEAVEKYSNKETVRTITQMAQQTAYPAKLGIEERKLLRSWRRAFFAFSEKCAR